MAGGWECLPKEGRKMRDEKERGLLGGRKRREKEPKHIPII